MLRHLQILRLGKEQLVRVLIRPHHACAWVHLRHLLRNLVCRCGRNMSVLRLTPVALRAVGVQLTVIAAKDEIIYWLEAEQCKEIP